MTNEKLLRAVGDIDDRFVEEADGNYSSVPGAAYAANTKTSTERLRSRRRPLKIAAAACAAVLIFTVGFFGGAGTLGNRSYDSKNGSEVNTGVPSNSTSDLGPEGLDGRSYDGESEWVPSSAEKSYNGAPVGEGSDTIFTETSGLRNSKLIYSATMSLQSTEFEKTCGFIKELAGKYFAYIESETVDNGNGSATYRRSASYTVRVPAENYEKFLAGMNDGCYVVSLNQKMTDVSEQYFDIEQKLETLRNKHDRLEELLKSADNMTDILKIEDALSENEYEINQYQGSLNKYNSLVSYSTVKISLKEVSRPDTTIGEKPGFFQKLGNNFSEGLANVGSALENLALWISYNIVTLIILAAIIIAVVKIHPVRRIKAAKEKKNG
ncbi:MAG: DUF4349 domain-containing protein [Firmicutes bacterium]|nr:DUF4349 domain-containing protein [Bacillota bacterium]